MARERGAGENQSALVLALRILVLFLSWIAGAPRIHPFQDRRVDPSGRSGFHGSRSFALRTDRPGFRRHGPLFRNDRPLDLSGGAFPLSRDGRRAFHGSRATEGLRNRSLRLERFRAVLSRGGGRLESGGRAGRNARGGATHSGRPWTGTVDWTTPRSARRDEPSFDRRGGRLGEGRARARR